MLKVKVQVNEEDSSLYYNYKDLRSLFLEMILIMAGKYKKVSLKVGLAVTVFILDSLAKTAEEEELEEINVSRTMAKKYVNKAIRKNKKKVDKKLELILDQELEEITAHELAVVSAGINNSSSIQDLHTAINDCRTSNQSLLEIIESIMSKIDSILDSGPTEENLDIEHEEADVIDEEVSEEVSDGPNEEPASADEELPAPKRKKGRPPKAKN